MTTRVPLSLNEWYHCFSRGVDKRKIFNVPGDYDRFLSLMYISNGDKVIHLSNLSDTSYKAVSTSTRIDRGTPIVEVGAYCLMPNHVHIVLKESTEGGISRYMQKIFTGYTMYFNKKNSRTGALLSGTYKSKHIDTDDYLKRAVAYVQLNPVELVNPNWKEGRTNIMSAERLLRTYKYSSLQDFTSHNTSQSILGEEIFGMYDKIPNIRDMLSDAQEYYTLQRQG